MAAIVRGVLRRGRITTAPSSSSPAAVRHRYLHRASNQSWIAKLSEAERVEASKQLDKMDEEMQSKLVQEVDALLQWSSRFSDDKRKFSRVLTFCGVPKGECRKKLISYSHLALAFIASWAFGRWEANRCGQYYNDKQRIQEEEEANQTT